MSQEAVKTMQHNWLQPISGNQNVPQANLKIIDVHSHAILNIGVQVPLANQARWSVEGHCRLWTRYPAEVENDYVPAVELTPNPERKL